MFSLGQFCVCTFVSTQNCLQVVDIGHGRKGTALGSSGAGD